ncbi:hypothetical protein [Neptuniibacter caesariensis]|uniref:Uncharacterized protein n=1 Tax=Neptuniibacter caesariensis TaxID=207954 RepID=A0A7U8C649_NEPCE|nr:hypothetical protein [Neptuniibacter caesariensis]EAR61994.1 hypothetical protein MED92_03563 [Oceanospirillum sp. MED92] [Neptuniibacter caesariensis]
MKKSTEKLLAYLFGVIFVIAILVIAIFIPSPKPFQYEVFKIVLAIATAGVAAFIPGFLNVQVGSWVRAGGAIAVFVIVFFFSPAKLAVDQQPDITVGDMLKAYELGRSLEYVKDEIDNHISYKNGTGEFDDMADLIYTNEKMAAIRHMEYLGFDRNDELAMLRTRTLSEWEGVNEAWELISRLEGYLEKKSKTLFYLFRASFISERINATIQENPNESISAWSEELLTYLDWLSKNAPELKELEYKSVINNTDNDMRYLDVTENILEILQNNSNKSMQATAESGG